MKCIELCIKRNVNWFDPNIRSEGIFKKEPEIRNVSIQKR